MKFVQCMKRRIEERNSTWGTVSIKVCEGYDVKKEKPEFDQIAKIAREQNLSLRDVKKEIEE